MKKSVQRRIFSALKYLMFFVASSFLVTCCFLVFFHYIELDEETIRRSAPITFFNVIFLSICFMLIDVIHRKITVERPVKRILEATEQITNGDFSVRIKPVHSKIGISEFDDIIDGLNKMAQELSGVETLRTDFVANVSHELKTPLAVIQNYGTLIQSPDLSEAEHMEYAKAITDTSRRLSNLITNILKLNRLENQQIYPNTEPYNLGEQLIECLLSFENVIEEKEFEIETDIDEEIVINADKELLNLVWNNLFSNAVKFTPCRGRISVRLEKESEYVIIIISDSGCGMNKETGAHIFEKFYQGDTSHATQGNGLGLALVKRVMDITDSEIAVESAPGKGSKFCVKLKV